MTQVFRALRQVGRQGGLALALLMCGTGLARADKIKNGTALFSGLDKITGRIIAFQAAMGETVQFGTLKVTSRACYTRPPTEAPQTDTFVEVDEVSAGKPDKRIFSGWMFAASPGLHGIEHPIYDIWLTNCKDPGETIVDAPQTADVDDPNALPPASGTPGASPNPAEAPAKPVAAAPAPKPKRVVRRAPAPAAPEASNRQPSQSFFPASQYPSDFAGRDPAGSSRR
ncbi:MAG TPA: DUF2155 domain-containing protein [Lichenihabitans sp.]|jgi:hypothetical protein|nr:DUF2155 domain-containing protein [Lichenihabitans sp.]